MMLLTNQAAADMKIENGAKAFVIPLHRGGTQILERTGRGNPGARDASRWNEKLLSSQNSPIITDLFSKQSTQKKDS